MDLMTAITSLRSVRQYAPTAISRTALEELLAVAVHAPSAMNAQPWAFGVVTGAEGLRACSARAKAHLLTLIDDASPLVRYRENLADPAFNIFYDAPALVLIYATAGGPYAEGDCCMAAQTLMLAAHDQGFGTCWIGFAQPFFDLPATKTERGVPDTWRLVAPSIVGVPAAATPAVDRRPPQVAFWK